MAAPGCTFTLNGERVTLNGSDLLLSAAEALRTANAPGCKSLKVSCGEGGCGACAVELLRPGTVSPLAVNSCLLPAAALHGCHVLTSEGLGNTRQGFHEVQARLAAFHGTQCGFCSPGVAVACHAALSAAAARAQQRGGASCSHSSANGSSCNGTQAGAADGGSAVQASELLAALDGNLCRCTGWRPIADMAKSFACDIDVEDLGLCSKAPGQLGPLSAQQLVPAALQQRAPPLPAHNQLPFEQQLQQLRPGSVLAPGSVQQVLEAMTAARAAGVRAYLMSGNTGAGVYHDQWQAARTAVVIMLLDVPELQQLELQPQGTAAAANGHSTAGANALSNGLQQHSDSSSPTAGGPVLVAGAAVTLAQLQRALQGAAAEQEHAGRLAAAGNLQQMVAHIGRIAGTLVRNAATLGGHLALARSRALESDLLPILIAAGAEVQLTGLSGGASWLSVEAFAAEAAGAAGAEAAGGDGSESPEQQLLQQLDGGGSLVTALRLPLPLESSTRFWSCKLTTHRQQNEHAAVNMSAWLAAGAAGHQLRLAVGTYQELLLQDVTPGGRHADYVRSAAPALLLKGLLAVLPQQLREQLTAPAGPKSQLLQWLLAAEAGTGAAVPRGSQELPVHDDTSSAPPLHWPAEKDAALLQASGQAVYADDTAAAAGALHAAYVTSSEPCAAILEVDWHPALEVEGVVGFVGPDDIPAGPNVRVQYAGMDGGWPHEPLFACRTVDYVGQPLGLIVAATQAAAREGAARVRVRYGPPPLDDATGRPRAAVLNLDDAAAAGSWYDLGPKALSTHGDVPGALAASVRRLSGSFRIGSQRHAYMEPQTAVASPDEGGRLSVISSSQGCDQVLWGVAGVLQLPHNQLHVRAVRVGGGFGGKADRAVLTAAAAATAAHKFQRQVRLVAAPTADAGMNGGRCAARVDWRAGVGSDGCVTALQLDVALEGGAFFGASFVETLTIPSGLSSVYALPAMRVAMRMARCNLAPRTTVRGPGKVTASIAIELVLQQLAAGLGSDALALRQALMLKLPDSVVAAASAAAAEGGGNAPATGDIAEQQAPLMQPHPKHLPGVLTDADKPLEPLFCMPLSPLPLEQYTLPYMWQQLQRKCGYSSRQQAVQAFNQQHALRKRGLALVPARFPIFHRKTMATVTIYTDGSMLLAHPGTEMGQGIATKAKQAAAAALGHLLPPSRRGELLALMRVDGGSSELMPHAGIAAGSSTSEAATAAITAACELLLERLRPAADKLAAAASRAAEACDAAAPVQDAPEVTWQAIVKAVAQTVPFSSPKVVLTATALSGLGPDVEGFAPGTLYHVLGAGAAEVEIDVLTGERLLLRIDLLVDAGRSVSPAIDLGQVEGAFMQGVGHVMTEEVLEDAATGANLSSRTWSYKPPGIAELPQEFNVSFLHESPLHTANKHRQLSAKGVGEPPMQLAAAVAAALQDAVVAAWQDGRLCSGGVAASGGAHCLHLPATTDSIKRALPPLVWAQGEGAT